MSPWTFIGEEGGLLGELDVVEFLKSVHGEVYVTDSEGSGESGLQEEGSRLGCPTRSTRLGS